MPPFEQRQFEKACYIGFRYGATFAQLEEDFAQENLGWRIMRWQLAREFNQDVRRIDWLREHDPQALSDASGILAAEATNQKVSQALK